MHPVLTPINLAVARTLTQDLEFSPLEHHITSPFMLLFGALAQPTWRKLNAELALLLRGISYGEIPRPASSCTIRSQPKVIEIT